MMELYEGTTIRRKEWHHLIRDYVRDVTERPELQKEEMFRYVG